VPKGKGIEPALGGREDRERPRGLPRSGSTWSSTTRAPISLRAKVLAEVDRADLQPGDFVVQPGGPGHAILVLDLATAPDGRRALLLGQGFMPAQSFQVLVPPGAKGPWFSLDGEAVDTPFWPAPFPWSSLRRMK
jgi:hypothetical protein